MLCSGDSNETVTIGEGLDLVVDVGGDGGLLHLAIAGGDAAVADVVLDGVVEEHRVLRDHADVRSQGRLLHLGEGKGRKGGGGGLYNRAHIMT